MKKFLTLIVSALLITCVCFSTACAGGGKTKFGKEGVAYDSQLDTLIQLTNGSIDVAIIDSIMAGYYCSTGEFQDDIKMLDVSLADENYGIAGRKDDKAFVSKINEALIALAQTDYADVATQYGVTSSTCLTSETVNPLLDATDDSWTAIKNSGKIVIGYTIFAPIAFDPVENVPTKGFDIDLAKKVVAYLNQLEGISLDLEFVEIDWDSKETLLEGGSIDLIWNGLTITEERSANMCISVPYLKNSQVAVIRAEDYETYQDLTKDNITEVFADAIIGFEGGSAGEDVTMEK